MLSLINHLAKLLRPIETDSKGQWDANRIRIPIMRRGIFLGTIRDVGRLATSWEMISP